jgi:hypothetical protein
MAAIRCQEVYRITYEATAGSGRRWVDRKGDKDEATAGATRGNARQRQATRGNARQREATRGSTEPDRTPMPSTITAEVLWQPQGHPGPTSVAV